MIALRSQSSLAYGGHGTSTVVPPPATIVDNDILAAFIFTGQGSAGGATITAAPAGFTAVGIETSVTDPSSFTGKYYLYWKRALGESGSYTFTTSVSCNSEAVLFSLSGCKLTGSPWGPNTTNNSGSGTVSTGPGITTTQANSWLIYGGHNWSATPGSVPPGMTQMFNVLGFDAYELRASAGATADRVQNPNGNTTAAGQMWAARMFELLEEPAAPVGGKPKVWTGSAWVEKPAKVWTGSAWIEKPVKVWNGSAWVLA